MRRPAQIFLWFAFCFEATTSCRRAAGHPTRIPANHSDIAINLTFPSSLAQQGTCGGVRSWIVRLGTSATPQWSQNFLFDGSLNVLFGCSGGLPCEAGTIVNREIDSIVRVSVEGLSLDPLAVETAGQGVNVLCRGVADREIIPESIVDDTSGQSTHSFTINVRVLRVGNTNPFPFESGGPMPPQTRHGTAASFSSRNYAIGEGRAGTAPRGEVLIAGGVQGEGTPGAGLPGSVWKFSPQTLRFSNTGIALTPAGTGLVGVSSTLFSENGVPKILFAGGASTTYQQSRQATIVAFDESVSYLTLVGGGQGQGRAFHTAAFLPRPLGRGLVVLIGGVPYASSTDTFGTTGSRTDYEYFVPSDATAGGGCAGVSGGFCTPTASQMSEARLNRGVVFEEGGSTKIELFLGSTTTQTSDLFVGDGDGSFAADVNIVGYRAQLQCGAVVTSSGNPALDGKPLGSGGFDAGRSSTLGQARESSTVLRNFLTKFARGDCQLTPLRDHTVLLSGGDFMQSTPGEAALERFARFPAAGEPTSDFVDSGDPSKPVCDAGMLGFGPGCVALAAGRYGHTAVVLEDTYTWLDGSVLMVGGATLADPSAELFVPAMTCDTASHSVPVHPFTQRPAAAGSNSSLPVDCDRDRRGERITNPQTGGWAY